MAPVLVLSESRPFSVGLQLHNGEIVYWLCDDWGKPNPPCVPVSKSVAVNRVLQGQVYKITSSDDWIVQYLSQGALDKMNVLYDLENPVSDPEPVLPGFWESIKSLWDSALEYLGTVLNVVITDGIETIYRLFTGNEIDAETAANWASYVPGANAFHKLAYGIDLKGEGDGTLSGSDYVDLALFMIPLPASWVGKGVTKAVARVGEKEAFTVLEKIALKEVELIAKGVTKVSLWKFLNIAAGKLLKNKLVQLVGSLGFLIFAATEIPQLINMRKFAYHQTLELAGQDPQTVSFALKRLEDQFDSLSYEINTSIKNGDITRVNEIIVDMQTVLLAYSDYVELKKSVLEANETYDVVKANSDLMSLQVQRLVEAYPPGSSTEPAYLIIRSVPSGAKIYIDDLYIFEVTDTKLLKPEGKYKITLKKSGYYDKETFDYWNAGKTGTLTLNLIPLSGTEPPVEDPPGTEPPIPEPPTNEERPSEDVIIELDPGAPEYNAWKITIKAVDSSTGTALNAWVLINDVFKNVATPASFYFQPEALYNIKLRLKGYKQGELDYTTKPLPTQ